MKNTEKTDGQRMTNTPETDAQPITPMTKLVPAEFARKLERERDQLRAELERLTEWDNFPPGYTDRERAIALLSQHNAEPIHGGNDTD